jgi:Ca2+-binding EF-hand superfamily protein
MGKHMRYLGKYGLGSLGLITLLNVQATCAREAATKSPATTSAIEPMLTEALKIRGKGEDVADVLKQLGAKFESGIDARGLDDYANHFDRTDPNQDGKHSWEEYVDQGRYMTPQARAGIFRAADGNGDGAVTRDEYILNRIITDEGKTIIQAMDDDRDGLVERPEFVKHASRLFNDGGLAEMTFAALDVNRDTGIPIPEYLRVWGQWARAGRPTAEDRIAARRAVLADAPGKAPAKGAAPGPVRPPNGPPSGRPSVDALFDRFDKDRDGNLEKEEVPAFVQQYIFPADANGDGVVTKKELQASR